MEQAGRAVMQLDRLQSLEAGKAQGLRIVAVGADIDQPIVVIDRQHDSAMAHADAAEGQFLVRRDDGFPMAVFAVRGMVSLQRRGGNQFQY
jgi:hypothetical protein